MLVAYILGGLYFVFFLPHGQENWDYLLYLSIPLAVVAYFINEAMDEKEKEKKAIEKRREDAEFEKELENRKWLEKVDPAEARRQARELELEKQTKTCYECKMQIPRYANICPYCRTRFK
ncbi:MAG TPA: hypothetical protein VLV54_18505 [Thermoanaerobaculia bacterium]|nr:hypothetical protein [Thermoanaerobaculia bacterium]